MAESTKIDDKALEPAARKLAAWFGYDFDGLHEARLKAPFKPWGCNGLADWHFQGHKLDVIDAVRMIVDALPPDPCVADETAFKAVAMAIARVDYELCEWEDFDECSQKQYLDFAKAASAALPPEPRIAKLATEVNKLRQGLAVIKHATLGYDDTAWLDKCTTLHDYCELLLDDTKAATLPLDPRIAELETKNARLVETLEPFKTFFDVHKKERKYDDDFEVAAVQIKPLQWARVTLKHFRQAAEALAETEEKTDG